MTTEATTNTTAPQSAPDAPPPPAPETAGSRFTYFKVSEGEIKKSMGKDQEPEVVSHVEGKILAFRNQEGKIGKETVVAFEVDLEGRDGERFRLSVSHQNLGSSMLATALVTLEPGAWVSIYAQRTKEKNDYGKYGTFINTKWFNTETRAWADIPVSKTDIATSATTWREAQDEIMEAVAAHPAYKDREKGGADPFADDGFSRFNQATLEKPKVWPLLKASAESQAAYLEWANEVLTNAYGFKGEYADFGDVSEKHWENLIEAVQSVSRTPSILKPFLS